MKKETKKTRQKTNITLSTKVIMDEFNHTYFENSNTEISIQTIYKWNEFIYQRAKLFHDTDREYLIKYIANVKANYFRVIYEAIKDNRTFEKFLSDNSQQFDFSNYEIDYLLTINKKGGK